MKKNIPKKSDAKLAFHSMLFTLWNFSLNNNLEVKLTIRISKWTMINKPPNNCKAYGFIRIRPKPIFAYTSLGITNRNKIVFVKMNFIFIV